METILYFNMGRGGRFYNGGHRTYHGKKTIGEVLSLCDSGKRWSFVHERDEKGRFCKPYYADQNGNFLIYVKDVETGVGTLDWDGIYDTDACLKLSECDGNDLKLILESNEWDKEDVIKEYFDNHTDLDVKWQYFNGDYEDLIQNYFSFSQIDISGFYIDEFYENK